MISRATEQQRRRPMTPRVNNIGKESLESPIREPVLCRTLLENNNFIRVARARTTHTRRLYTILSICSIRWCGAEQMIEGQVKIFKKKSLLYFKSIGAYLIHRLGQCRGLYTPRGIQDCDDKIYSDK